MTGKVIHRYFRACTIGAAMFGVTLGVNIGCDAAPDVDERSGAEQDSSDDADESDCDKGEHKGHKGGKDGHKGHKGDEPCDGDKPPPPKQGEPCDPEAGEESTGAPSDDSTTTGEAPDDSTTTGEAPDDGTTGEPPDDSTTSGDESTGDESTGTPIPQ